MIGLTSTLWITVYDNDLDAFVPEIWAAESLLILENNVVAAQLVHRNFENQIPLVITNMATTANRMRA